MSDLVSVIIPVFNAEKYLKKCINSVLEQTYKELQIILIDDGSNDKSGDFCDYYSVNNNRIEVIHQKNKGVSEARNIGINLAEGKYICFVDSDDYIDNNYIEKLYEAISIDNVQMSLCSVYYKGANNSKWECKDEIIKIDNNNINKFIEINKTNLIYGPCNKMYLSYIIKENNITFEKNMTYGEDLVFNYNYLYFVNQLSFTKGTFYYYIEDNISSLSSKYRADRFVNGLVLYEYMKEFCIYKDMFSLKMQELLLQRLFDDAYNTIFEIVIYKQGIFRIFSEIKSILNNEYTIDSFKYLKKNSYIKRITNWMQSCSVLKIIIYIKLAKIKKILSEIGN